MTARGICSCQSRGSLRLKGAGIFEFFGYLVIATLAYIVALRFVYPGYFDPFWPHHSDFYLAGDSRAGPLQALKNLRWSRPVGGYTLALLGNAPMRVGIAIIAGLTILNATLCAFLFSLYLKCNRRALLCISSFLYFFTLFSAPGFYIFYSHDVWAQTSFFLLLIGCSLFYALMNVNVAWAGAALFTCALLAFCSKETYALSYLTLSGAFVLLSRWRNWSWRLVPGLILICALGLSLAVGIIGRSEFFGQAGMEAYVVDFSPGSVLREFWRYVAAGVSEQLGLALLVTLIAVALRKHDLGKDNPALLGLVAAFAGATAWLPNSLLPNHFSPGYSWNGAYLFFLPFLLLPYLLSGLTTRMIGAALVAVLLLNPLFSRVLYAPGDWVLLQERTQRNYWSALKREIQALPAGASMRILVTGQTFPFSPFHHPNSLNELTDGRNIHFSIVEYPPFVGKPSARVTFLPLGSYNLGHYDRIWVFRPDGALLKALDHTQMAAIKVPPGVTVWDILNMPPVLAKILAGTPVDACTALEATVMGNELDYGKAFLAGCAAAQPGNAYAWYNIGIVRQAAGDLSEAIEAFRKAIELDNPTQPNPVFRQRLEAAQAGKAT